MLADCDARTFSKQTKDHVNLWICLLSRNCLVYACIFTRLLTSFGSSHPSNSSNYTLTQTANRPIDGSRCIQACGRGKDDLLQLKPSGRMGKERRRRAVGVKRPVSENLRNYWSVSTRNRLCGFFRNGPKKRKPGTAQDASNLEADELLRQQTKTTPAPTFCRPCARNRGRNLHTPTENTDKNVASSVKHLSFTISMVLLRIWVTHRESTEPSCFHYRWWWCNRDVFLANFGPLGTTGGVISMTRQVAS